MELWIRSQDKKEMIKANEISIDSEIIDYKETGKSFISVNDYGFGTYKSEKRALEVLDEIQNGIEKNGFEEERYNMPSGCYETISKKVYEMPKE